MDTELVENWFSSYVLARTRTDRVTEHRDGVFWVDTAEGRHYRVQITLGDSQEIYVVCNCTNGSKLGDWPKCHHAAAAMMKMLSNR